MRIGRSLRGARAAAFAVACVGLSAAGHVYMSGAGIPAWALVLAVVAVGGAGYVLAGRQRGFAPIAALMLVGELGLHLLFTAAQNTHDAVMTAVPGTPRLPGNGSGSQGSASSMAWMSGHGDPLGMIAIHVVSGLLCAWWLRQGEAAVFRLLYLLAQLAVPLLVIVWLLASAVRDLTGRVAADLGTHPTPGLRLLGHAVVRRGPPATVFSM